MIYSHYNYEQDVLSIVEIWEESLENNVAIHGTLFDLPL